MTALLAAVSSAGDALRAAAVFAAFFKCAGASPDIERCSCDELQRLLHGSAIAETVLGQLDQMEDDFPSAGKISRTNFFWWSLRKRMESRGPEKLERAAVKIMERQLHQNAVVATLAKALVIWRAQSAPPEDWAAVIAYLLAEEIEMHSFPRIEGLQDANRSFAQIRSAELRRQFMDFFREERRQPPIQVQRPPPARRRPAPPPPQAIPEMMEFDEFSWVSESLIE